MTRITNNRLLAFALILCAGVWLSPGPTSAGERILYDQYTFGPLTTRALFPGLNLAGPGVKDTDWYPVYLVRDTEACGAPFPLDHSLVFNARPNPSDPWYQMDCPLLFEGFGIFEDSISVTPVPRISNLWSDFIPVYFVHKDDVNLEMTWGDLMYLVDEGCAIGGMANRYREILQSESPNPVMFPGGAKVPSFNIRLSGYLDDGTRFSVHTVGQLVPGPTFPSAVVRTYRIKGLEEKGASCS